MNDMELFDVFAAADAGRLIAAVDVWAGMDGVQGPAVEHVRMLAAMLDGQCAAIAVMRGRAPASQVAAAVKVSREFREALRAVTDDMARQAAAASKAGDPLARLLGELSAPVAHDGPR